MKIRIRIIGTFLAVAIIGGVVGYTGVSGIDNVFNSFNVVSHETVPELRSLGEIDIITHELVLAAVNYVLVTQLSIQDEDHDLELELEHLLEEFEETNIRFDDELLKFKKLIHEGEDIDHIVELKAILYVASLTLIEKSTSTDLQTIFIATDDLEHAEHEIHEAISILTEEEEEELEIRHTMAETLSTDTINFVIITSVSGMLFAIILGVFISTTINRPITELKKGSVQLGKGDFTELKVSGNDELTDLIHTFNNMATDILQSKIIITETLESTKKQKDKLDAAHKKLKESELLRKNSPQ